MIHRLAGTGGSTKQEKQMSEALKNRDYYLVIDKSGSMTTQDCAGGKSRWDSLKETTQAVARKLNEYDPDGITVVPFATQHKWYANTTPDKVDQIFTENEPNGSTNLAGPLKACFKDYLDAKGAGKAKANGAIVVVITDGSPNDEQEVVEAIVGHTKKLDNGDGEFGISFLQIGKDLGAAAYLRKLDDGLEKVGAKFDIVDTKTFEELENSTITEALLASLSD
jgi:uncharacterized protein YegL